MTESTNARSNSIGSIFSLRTPPVTDSAPVVGKSTSTDDLNVGTLVLGIVCVVAGIVTLIGLVMAFTTGAGSADSLASAARTIAMQSTGRFIATIGLITAFGTGILIAIRRTKR